MENDVQVDPGMTGLRAWRLKAPNRDHMQSGFLYAYGTGTLFGRPSRSFGFIHLITVSHCNDCSYVSRPLDYNACRLTCILGYRTTVVRNIIVRE
jgi:hypothetical protein